MHECRLPTGKTAFISPQDTITIEYLKNAVAETETEKRAS